MSKIMQLHISLERHLLTKLLKQIMNDLKTTRNIKIVHYLEGRMFGLVEAYHVIGIIDTYARMRYISIITDVAWRQEEVIINEV